MKDGQRGEQLLQTTEALCHGKPPIDTRRQPPFREAGGRKPCTCRSRHGF